MPSVVCHLTTLQVVYSAIIRIIAEGSPLARPQFFPQFSQRYYINTRFQRPTLCRRDNYKRMAGRYILKSEIIALAQNRTERGLTFYYGTSDSYSACYWKNGVRTELSANSSAGGIVVVTQ